jgi:hypothetical protein
MDREAIRAFAQRRWAEAEEAKREYWARRFRAGGSAETLRAAQALWQHVRRVRPDWPTPQDRADDLAHHTELKRRIDRIAHVFARR